ncbi:TRAP transporter small permease, partial [Chloroflexota bacterium]
MLSSRLEVVRRVWDKVIKLITWVGAVSLAIMVLIIFTNVIGRYIFRQPFMGSIEITQLLLVITVFFAVAYTQYRKGHIIFNEIVARFPKRTQHIILSVMYFLAAIFFFIVALQ